MLGAGIANLVLMRRDELKQGVDVFDADGTNRGKVTLARESCLSDER